MTQPTAQRTQGTPRVAVIDIWAFQVDVQPSIADIDLAGLGAHGAKTPWTSNSELSPVVSASSSGPPS
jgi:hypothetical protein